MTRLWPGELLAFYGNEPSSRFISLVTRGPSHVGIICYYERRALLVESTTLTDLPCVIQDKPVKGVQAHQPADRIAFYNGAVYRIPLSKAWRLYADESKRLTEFLIERFVRPGTPYDFPSALTSGTRLLKYSRFLPYPDDGTEFCSELCATARMRVGLLPIGNPERYNPASLCRTGRRLGIDAAPILLKRSIWIP